MSDDATSQEARFRGLDDRSIRQQCLTLAVNGNESDPPQRIIARATIYERFVLEGQASE